MSVDAAKIANEPGRRPLVRPGWFLVILCLLPSAMIAMRFSPEYGFLALPRFGQPYWEQALEPVRRYAPPPSPKDVGYDGQFYAQLALSPLLRDPQLKAACDALSYRAKRIGLPWLAYLGGLGQAWPVLQIYAVLNAGFWVWLLWMLVREYGCDTAESQALLIGILWTAGVCVSLSRALTDLPSLCLSIAALQALMRCEQASLAPVQAGWLGWWGRFCGGLAALTKETSLLSIFSYLTRPWRRAWPANLTTVMAVGLPAMGWGVYVWWIVGPDRVGVGNFAGPWVGFYGKVHAGWLEALTGFPRIPWLELIAPWSVVCQMIWLTRYADPRSRWWWFGYLYVVLALFLGEYVWATQSAYSRALLPMIVSFNVLLYQTQRGGPAYRWWWWLGNLGFLDRALPGILILAAVGAAARWRGASRAGV